MYICVTASSVVQSGIPQLFHNSAVVGGVVGAIIAVLIIAIAVVVIAVLVLNSRRAKLKLQRDPK